MKATAGEVGLNILELFSVGVRFRNRSHSKTVLKYPVKRQKWIQKTQKKKRKIERKADGGWNRGRERQRGGRKVSTHTNTLTHLLSFVTTPVSFPSVCWWPFSCRIKQSSLVTETEDRKRG